MIHGCQRRDELVRITSVVKSYKRTATMPRVVGMEKPIQEVSARNRRAPNNPAPPVPLDHAETIWSR